MGAAATTSPLRAFTDCELTKEQLLDRIGIHEEADALTKGHYSKISNGMFTGCAVGCSVVDPAKPELLPGNPHRLYPEKFGLPVWLAMLEDGLFENLPEDDAMKWPRRLIEAIPVGAVLDEVFCDRYLVRTLREVVLPLAPSWHEPVREDVKAAIEGVIAALENDGFGSDAAGSAARAAWSAADAAGSAADAAWSAADAAGSAAGAAWSAARAAGSAAGAAWSAARAAWSAARDEAYRKQADILIEELEKLASTDNEGAER